MMPVFPSWFPLRYYDIMPGPNFFMEDVVRSARQYGNVNPQIRTAHGLFESIRVIEITI